ncbi:hypothetical protein [Dasania marina]|uniref:hypothetical protein n=1 Tax=Dasania marina TaxID=471499 RepID=UPI000382B6CB|nr:hypothetical protein [Dasania marina]
MKPLLLSAFVFPGAGYFLLKKPIQGVISALVTIAVLIVFIKEAVYKSNIISQGIVNGEIAIDITAIQQAVLNTPGQISPQTLGALSWLLAAVWLWGMIDCYRLAKKLKT